MPRSYGVQASETVFDGYQTINRIRSAESQVLAARETLRNTEQTTLLSGVQAYMDVLQNSAIVDLDRNNVDVLKEQLRETQDRFTVGEVTRTDVAQAEASLASANAQLLSDQAVLEASVATYRQVIGDEPKVLAPVRPLVRPLPRTLPEAVNISQVEHPAIVAQEHGVDAALLSIKIAEGALYPQASVQAQVTQAFDVNSTPGMRAFNAQITGNLTIPIYQGGAEYAGIRQSKEGLSVQELKASSTRDQIRAERRRVLGPQPGRDRRGEGGARLGRRQRGGARRRPRGGESRPAHHARRAQRPAGSAFRRAPSSSARSTTRSSFPTRCCRRSAGSTCRPSGSRSPNTIRASTSTRSRASGSGSARPTGNRRGRRPDGPSGLPAAAIARLTLSRGRESGSAPRSAAGWTHGDRSRAAQWLKRWARARSTRVMGDREYEAVRRAQRAHEPSMEEILASIRTIIAEEREPAQVPESRSAPERPAAPGPQVVYSKAEPAATRAPARADRRDGRAEGRLAPAPNRRRTAASEPLVETPAEDDAPLLSPDTDKAVASAFEELSANLAARTAELAEGMAREMLRPMLKAWLDENLPAIVERLVRAEIERIVRAAR